MNRGGPLPPLTFTASITTSVIFAAITDTAPTSITITSATIIATSTTTGAAAIVTDAIIATADLWV